MKRKKIGILGFQGLVGQEALRFLRNTNQYDLLLGSRRGAAATEHDADDNAITYHQVDIFDQKQLEAFCRQCDLVINCAGPSSKILSAVAKVCIEHRIPYVDPAGDKAMATEIEAYLAEKQAKSLCVISAGIYPGLTEIFVDFISAVFFDQLATLKLYFAGVGSFSRNGAYDIVSSLANDEGVGMAFCKNGQVEPISTGFGADTLLPEPIGRVNVLPVVGDEFLKVSRQHNIEEAYFYNTFPEMAMLSQFVMIKAAQQFNTEAQKLASAEQLIDVYQSGGKKSDCLLLHAVATGQREGKLTTLNSTLSFDSDWNALSGTVAAIVADELLKKQDFPTGCCYAQEVVASEAIIPRLLQAKNGKLVSN